MIQNFVVRGYKGNYHCSSAQTYERNFVWLLAGIKIAIGLQNPLELECYVYQD